MDHGVPVVRVTRATPVLPPGVTDDTPDFKRDMVMLDIPDKLFGDSFTIVSNISKIFGDLMMVGCYIMTVTRLDTEVFSHFFVLRIRLVDTQNSYSTLNRCLAKR